ncbi:hypothetical protein BRADI_4g16075v3 [Brachypodium distachyon]|uniref:Myb/SANT-like domain-containing protein n=1 Tax=Brachypodium distachyon TaxID=15368 RepID=A0A2K2CN38_BRADI|nr:hypothetical protein BRADI_4g16075v3 [Brachypodium distachyon]
MYIDGSEKQNQSKENWDAMAAKAFCQICAEQTLEGNRPTAFLSTTGYKNLERYFFQRTRRNYTRRHFKNRWDAMKALYSAWKYYRSRCTRLGWDQVTRTVTADEDCNATLTVEIESIMQKVVECGATEESPEYYMTTKLFGKVENRVFFNTMKTKEGRLCWLTRMYEDRKRN